MIPRPEYAEATWHSLWYESIQVRMGVGSYEPLTDDEAEEFEFTPEGRAEYDADGRTRDYGAEWLAHQVRFSALVECMRHWGEDVPDDCDVIAEYPRWEKWRDRDAG